MPTGTENDWSGRSQSTAQDDPLIPAQAKRGLNEVIGREGRNALFLQQIFNEGLFLGIRCWGTPDVKAVPGLRLKQTGSEQCAARPTCTEKKETRSHWISFLGSLPFWETVSFDNTREMEGAQGFSLRLLLCEPLQCIGESLPEFCVREGASGGQLPIQQIDLTLPCTQLLVLRRELLLHLIQPTAQGGDHLVFGEGSSPSR